MFWDKPEELPGCFIIQREVQKAISGKPFFYNDGESGKPVRCDEVQEHELKYFVDLWDNYHYFGLPHGSGWASERQWLLNVLKAFERAYKETQNFQEEQAIKKARLEAGAHGRD